MVEVQTSRAVVQLRKERQREVGPLKRCALLRGGVQFERERSEMDRIKRGRPRNCRMNRVLPRRVQRRRGRLEVGQTQS